MFKRIILSLILIPVVISIAATFIYFINPYSLKTDNIRPRVLGFDIYQIPSKSMQPLLYPGDYITVSNLAYAEELPKRNDVVVFYKSDEKTPQTKVQFIKRVVAIAGDNIQVQNGKLFVNKKFVTENYVSEMNNKTPYSLNMNLVTVPPEHVFVMGDNRDISSDSRKFGAISTENIIAKASKILYGINNRTGNKIE